MDGFKAWILAVCGSMILSSLFKTVLSDSSMKKSVNIFFSLFILFYTVIPLSGALSENKIFQFESTTESNYNELYDKAYEQIIEQSITTVCNDLSVDITAMEIESYLDEEGIMCVDSIKISVAQKNKGEEIKLTINKRLGFEVEVY